LKDLFTTVSGGVGVDIVGGIGHEADVAIAENEIFSAKTKSVPKLDSPHPSWLFKKFRFAYFRCWILWLFPEYPARAGIIGYTARRIILPEPMRQDRSLP
jgi:hypothetical protein